MLRTELNINIENRTESNFCPHITLGKLCLNTYDIKTLVKTHILQSTTQYIYENFTLSFIIDSDKPYVYVLIEKN